MIRPSYRKESRYPDFDSGRHFQYLMRGLLPFLLQLVALVPIIFVLLLFSAAFSSA
jgi:hypothetical protein